MVLLIPTFKVTSGVQSTGKIVGMQDSCSPSVVSHPGEGGSRHVHLHHLRLHRHPVRPVRPQPLGALRLVDLAGELLVVAGLESINDETETSVSFQQGFYCDHSVVAKF